MVHFLKRTNLQGRGDGGRRNLSQDDRKKGHSNHGTKGRVYGYWDQGEESLSGLGLTKGDGRCQPKLRGNLKQKWVMYVC